jgi:hypothetical protein
MIDRAFLYFRTAAAVDLPYRFLRQFRWIYDRFVQFCQRLLNLADGIADVVLCGRDVCAGGGGTSLELQIVLKEI